MSLKLKFKYLGKDLVTSSESRMASVEFLGPEIESSVGNTSDGTAAGDVTLAKGHG